MIDMILQKLPYWNFEMCSKYTGGHIETGDKNQTKYSEIAHMWIMRIYMHLLFMIKLRSSCGIIKHL